MVSQSACEGTKFSDLVILYECYFFGHAENGRVLYYMNLMTCL